MVFEMVYLNPEQGDAHYESVDSAETILAAFKAGKNTVLHFEKNATYSCGESYATITGYNCHDPEYTVPEKIFVDPDIDNVGQYIMINSTRVENNKLYVPIYID